MFLRRPTLLGWWVLASCVPSRDAAAVSNSTTGSVAASGTTSTGGRSSSGTVGPDDPRNDSTTSGATTDSTDSTDSTGAMDSAGVVGFLVPVDGGPVFECSTFEQDCRPGEKCTAWADDGGSIPNATRCVPIPDAPDQPGDACTYEGDYASGFDSCSAGSFCAPSYGAGELVCTAFCSGSDAAPVCSSPFERCVIPSRGALALCVPYCNPLDAEFACFRGQACYGTTNGPTCEPDASGDEGELFDTCEFLNACDPGLACEAADRVGFCAPGAAACCTAYCDPSAPDCPESMTCEMLDGGGSPPAPVAYGICVQET